MKEYYNITINNRIAEFDGKSIVIYDKVTLGTVYMPNMIYWKGSEESLIDYLKSKIIFNSSDLGTILNGKV